MYVGVRSSVHVLYATIVPINYGIIQSKQSYQDNHRRVSIKDKLRIQKSSKSRRSPGSHLI